MPPEYRGIEAHRGFDVNRGRVISLPPHLEALRKEALRVSCEAWAIQKRWRLGGGIDRSGPCPKCMDGTDRFSIHTRKNVFNCRRCGISGDSVIDLVMQTEDVDFTRACEIVTGRSASAPVDEERAERLRQENDAVAAEREAEEERRRRDAIERAQKICNRAAKVQWDDPADPVAGYLRLRGIVFRAARPKLGVIARHPWVEKQGALWVTVHEGPAMIAAIRKPGNELSAVHQTWLDLEQPKGRLVLPPDAEGRERATKKVIGSKKGGAICLFTPQASVRSAAGSASARPTGQGPRRRIVMGEGIETTLTAMAHAFEPDTAYWAGIDLGNMSGRAARTEDGRRLEAEPDLDDRDCFLPPDWCEELVYLCDSDEPRNHTEEKVIRGLRRAHALRELARQQNADLPALTVSYVPPLGDGKDLNDLVGVR